MGAGVVIWVWITRYSGPPRLNFLALTVNREIIKILPGERISLHPSDRVKVSGISTNIPLSLGVRLFSDNLDVAGLLDSELSISELLEGREIFDHYSFHVEVKYKNIVLGYFDLQVRPYVEEWLERANRIINDDQRISFLERASALLPSEKTIRDRLLNEYKSRGYFHKALPILEKSVSDEEDRGKIRELADLYGKAGNAKGLISALERLLEMAPDDARARLELAEAFEKSENWEAAAANYEALLVRTSEEASVPIHKRLGYVYMKSGKIEKAISAFLAAAKWDQKDANLFYNLAYLYEKIDDREKAAFYLRNAVTLNPEDRAGRLRLAERFLDAGEWKRAEQILLEVLDKDPGAREALVMLARALDGMKDMERLAAVYYRILEKEPANEIVLYNLAVAEYEMGRFDNAMSNLNKYVGMNPGDESAHRVIFDIHRKRNDTYSAAKEAEILISINPTYTTPYGFLFSYLLDKGLYDEIIRIMKSGVSANPTAEELLEYLLDAYLRTGREIEAMDTMESILKLRPRGTTFLMRLAALREKHGQTDRAMDIYRRILEIEPDHREAESAYLRLRLKGIGIEGE
jgi:tetratricopeptide (TPR) repeat protein